MKVGDVIRKPRKFGGGAYVIIGIVNCDRCQTLIEEREVTEPSKSHIKRGRYYAQYAWCHKCGLYDYLKSSNVTIKKIQCKKY